MTMPLSSKMPAQIPNRCPRAHTATRPSAPGNSDRRADHHHRPRPVDRGGRRRCKRARNRIDRQLRQHHHDARGRPGRADRRPSRPLGAGPRRRDSRGLRPGMRTAPRAPGTCCSPSSVPDWRGRARSSRRARRIIPCSAMLPALGVGLEWVHASRSRRHPRRVVPPASAPARCPASTAADGGGRAAAGRAWRRLLMVRAPAGRLRDHGSSPTGAATRRCGAPEGAGVRFGCRSSYGAPSIQKDTEYR